MSECAMSGLLSLGPCSHSLLLWAVRSGTVVIMALTICTVVLRTISLGCGLLHCGIEGLGPEVYSLHCFQVYNLHGHGSEDCGLLCNGH